MDKNTTIKEHSVSSALYSRNAHRTTTIKMKPFVCHSFFQLKTLRQHMVHKIIQCLPQQWLKATSACIITIVTPHIRDTAAGKHTNHECAAPLNDSVHVFVYCRASTLTYFPLHQREGNVLQELLPYCFRLPSQQLLQCLGRWAQIKRHTVNSIQCSGRNMSHTSLTV